MNSRLKILVGLYFGSMVLSGLLSPWVYWGVIKVSEGSSLEIITYLAQKEFPDYFDRFRWLAVLLGFPWLVKACLNRGEERKHFWRKIGFFAFRNSQKTLIRSFIIGSLLILSVVIAQIIAGQFYWRETFYQNMGSLFLNSLLGAILVSVFEEGLFRGVLFRIFLSFFRPIIAIIVSALFFAYVHFKMPDIFWESTSKEVYWYSGLQVAWGTLTGLAYTIRWVEFINLTLLGIILSSWTYQRQQLWSAIGFHAGAVFILLLAHRSFQIKGIEWAWFFGSSSIKDGFLCTILLASLVFWNFWRVPLKKIFD